MFVHAQKSILVKGTISIDAELKSKIRSSFARAGMPCSLSSSAPRPMRIRSKNFPISPTHEPATPIIFPDCIGTRGQTTWQERYATFGEDLRRNRDCKIGRYATLPRRTRIWPEGDFRLYKNSSRSPMIISELTEPN